MSANGDAIIAIGEKLGGNILGDEAIEEEEEEEEKKDPRRRYREILLERNEEGYRYESWRWREIARIKHDKKDIRWEMLNENEVIELVIRNLSEDEILRKLNRLKEWSTREVYYSKEGLFLPDENPKTPVVLRPHNPITRSFSKGKFRLHHPQESG